MGAGFTTGLLSSAGVHTPSAEMALLPRPAAGPRYRSGECRAATVGSRCGVLRAAKAGSIASQLHSFHRKPQRLFSLLGML